jgi:hypothetical protein
VSQKKNLTKGKEEKLQSSVEIGMAEVENPLFPTTYITIFKICNVKGI